MFSACMPNRHGSTLAAVSAVRVLQLQVQVAPPLERSQDNTPPHRYRYFFLFRCCWEMCLFDMPAAGQTARRQRRYEIEAKGAAGAVWAGVGQRRAQVVSEVQVAGR